MKYILQWLQYVLELCGPICLINLIHLVENYPETSTFPGQGDFSGIPTNHV